MPNPLQERVGGCSSLLLEAWTSFCIESPVPVLFVRTFLVLCLLFCVLRCACTVASPLQALITAAVFRSLEPQKKTCVARFGQLAAVAFYIAALLPDRVSGHRCGIPPCPTWRTFSASVVHFIC